MKGPWDDEIAAFQRKNAEKKAQVREGIRVDQKWYVKRAKQNWWTIGFACGIAVEVLVDLFLW